MKKSTILFLLVISCFSTFAQDRPPHLPEQARLFQNFHGIVSSGGVYLLEGQGYSIRIFPLAMQASKAAIDSIGNTRLSSPKGFLGRFLERHSPNNVRKTEYQLVDSALPLPNRMVVATNHFSDKLKQAERSYILRTREDEILDVYLVKSNDIDSVFVNQLLLSLYYDGVPKSVLTPAQALSFDFAGRKIDLYPPGYWNEGHNLSAWGDQLNWSIHDNYEDAAKESLFQLGLNRLRFDEKEKGQDTVDVIFEGTPTRAIRVVYKRPWFGYAPGELIVYYVTAEVRGKYVHCVLSHYDHEIDQKDVVKKVIPKLMRLKQDTSATGMYKLMPRVPAGQDYWNRSTEHFLLGEYHFGAWHPLGRLTNSIGTSPAFGVTTSLRLAKQWKLDGRIFLMVPLGAKPFPYHLPDTVLSAKLKTLSFGMGTGVTHANKIGKKWFLDQSVGVGMMVIDTDQKKPKIHKDEAQHYHTLSSIDFSVGVNLRHYIKRGNYIGLNVTYHYTPFTLFEDFADKSFGNQAVGIGLIWGVK